MIKYNTNLLKKIFGKKFKRRGKKRWQTFLRDKKTLIYKNILRKYYKRNTFIKSDIWKKMNWKEKKFFLSTDKKNFEILWNLWVLFINKHLSIYKNYKLYKQLFFYIKRYKKLLGLSVGKRYEWYRYKIINKLTNNKKFIKFKFRKKIHRYGKKYLKLKKFIIKRKLIRIEDKNKLIKFKPGYKWFLHFFRNLYKWVEIIDFKRNLFKLKWIKKYKWILNILEYSLRKYKTVIILGKIKKYKLKFTINKILKKSNIIKMWWNSIKFNKYNNLLIIIKYLMNIKHINLGENIIDDMLGELNMVNIKSRYNYNIFIKNIYKMFKANRIRNFDIILWNLEIRKPRKISLWELREPFSKILYNRKNWHRKDNLIRFKLFRKKLRNKFKHLMRRRSSRRIRKHKAFMKLIRAYLPNIIGMTENNIMKLWFPFRRGQRRYWFGANLVNKFSNALILMPSRFMINMGVAPTIYTSKMLENAGFIIINGIQSTQFKSYIKPKDISQILPSIYIYIKKLFKYNRWVCLFTKAKNYSFIHADFSMLIFYILRWPFSYELFGPKFFSERWIRYLMADWPIRLSRYRPVKSVWKSYKINKIW